MRGTRLESATRAKRRVPRRARCGSCLGSDEPRLPLSYRLPAIHTPNAVDRQREVTDIPPLSNQGSVEQLIECYPVSYTHLRAHETRHDLVCRLLLEKKKKK